jgi:hypothetical protein
LDAAPPHALIDGGDLGACNVDDDMARAKATQCSATPAEQVYVAARGRVGAQRERHRQPLAAGFHRESVKEVTDDGVVVVLVNEPRNRHTVSRIVHNHDRGEDVLPSVSSCKRAMT